jgi:hypothetical protein
MYKWMVNFFYKHWHIGMFDFGVCVALKQKHHQKIH